MYSILRFVHHAHTYTPKGISLKYVQQKFVLITLTILSGMHSAKFQAVTCCNLESR